MLTSLVVLDDQEHVHGSGFGEILVLAEEPENLLAALLLRAQVDVDGRAVVAADFAVSDAARKGSYVLRIGQKSDWLEASWEVGTNRAGNYEKQGVVARADTESGLKQIESNVFGEETRPC